MTASLGVVEDDGLLSLARRAADKVFDDPDDAVDFEPSNEACAAAAVTQLAARWAAAGGTVHQMRANARAGAETLSDDPLQGLGEIVQNADDVEAAEVRFVLDGDVLYVSHNGRPVVLKDVHFLATPWLTTKRGRGRKLGRFGIGMSTIHAIADAFELHSGPYHVRFGEPNLETVAVPNLPAAFDDPRSTVFVIRLREHALDPEQLLAWAKSWDDSGLLFCAAVRSVSFATTTGTRELTLAWSGEAELPVVVGGESLMARIRTATAPNGRAWAVTSAEPNSPKGVARSHKKTDPTTPIGVALPVKHHEERGAIYAGLPIVPTRLPARVNAQLDPVTGRRTLADRPWNDAVLELVAELWPYAVINLFDRDATAAWSSVPLLDDQSSEPGPAARFEALLLERARDDLPIRLSFEINGERVGITRLATSEVGLDGLLTDEELATLAGVEAALPGKARDAKGRWRIVLADWRSHGADIPEPVTIADAMGLIGDAGRDPRSVIALTAAAIDGGLEAELAEVACVVTRDGHRLRPPARDSTEVLVTHDRGLASVLGMAIQLHPAHVAPTSSAMTVLHWLEEREAVLDDDDSRAIVSRLSAAGLAGRPLPDVLTDIQLRALRDAFERLTPADLTTFGPGVGWAVRVEGFQFDGRRRKIVVDAHPAAAYLPKAIDREPDGFHVAAAATPGITWLASRYSTALKSDRGRSGLGAQRFLGILRAETAPRVTQHRALTSRYAYERRLGLPANGPASPQARSRHLEDLGADFTLDDLECRDLDAVLLDIAKDRKATSRRHRAAAVLATIGRAWPSMVESTHVDAARAHHGWRIKGPTRSWWLWRAATIAWLDNNSSQPSAPIDLRLRTTGTVAVHGRDDEAYLHRAFDIARRDVLAALGVTGEPNTADLVGRLRELRDGDEDPRAQGANAAVVYQALSERLGTTARLAGDLTSVALRRAFNQGDGLVHTAYGWRPGTHVLRGEPVFGTMRTFVPQVPGADRLWQALSVREPGIDDCLDVLSELARAGADDAASQTIILETVRLLAQLVAAGPTTDAQRRRLSRVPLWTSTGWSTERPIYAIDDPVLAGGLSAAVSVWVPGGELSQFSALIGPFRLTPVSAVAHPDTPDAVVHEDATLLLRDAIGVLHEDLARNDPSTRAALRITWTAFETFEVRVADSVRVVAAGIEGGGRDVEVAAYADAQAGALFVTDPEGVSTVEAGGFAMASLFRADRRRVAHAWLAAVQQARTGRAAIEMHLAAERAESEQAASAADIAARLAELQNQAANRRKVAADGQKPTKGGAARPASGSSSGATAKSASTKHQNPPPPRVLVDLDRLRVIDPDGKIIDPRASGRDGGGTRRRSTGLADPKADGATPRGRSAARSYTDLEKETLGFELACMVLASDADDMVDLRAQRNVGADAINKLRQFFELKVYAGAEPDVIKLEPSEISRAMSTPDFFLVVVSNVEGEDAHPKVRVIVDPIAQLGMVRTSEVRFSGVRNSRSLVFELASDSDLANGNE